MVDGGQVGGSMVVEAKDEDKDRKAGGGTIFRGAIDHLTLGDVSLETARYHRHVVGSTGGGPLRRAPFATTTKLGDATYRLSGAMPEARPTLLRL
uniref:Uncharacterized protein n=1 Tax=Chromera velia CCMP2878 TaxID=1169474 RepID=A0A0G4HZF6_9ALVE|eukprot:Cvel_9720.t1-p1 / transcript=Cvel_9720.t1 / gene=Cvel_9720 / organism=Chromera_velia_CCMP2878 / gene_product=hypothetical protein / transcript_product=hypothetical protein / location=Cvel_scaffold568:3749-4030(+) / protein_length=94 / sequence_SO=supercontig / SO=protein_coding / is_pseudo=false